MSATAEVTSHYLAVFNTQEDGLLRLVIGGSEEIVKMTPDEARSLATVLFAEADSCRVPKDKDQVL